MVSIFESSFFSKQSENPDKTFSSLTSTAEIRFTKFRFSVVDNPRRGSNFESTTKKETSKWSFLCFRVSEHFPSTGILELLYVDNLMFTGRRSDSGSNFFKVVKETRLH